MSKVTLKVDLEFEELKKVISRLSEDEKEALFFELNPAPGVRLLRRWKKGLSGKMKKGKLLT